MGPYGSGKPDIDIAPQRLSAVDVVSLDDREIRATLVKLAGHPDPAVATAVVDAVQEVILRTRCQG